MKLVNGCAALALAALCACPKAQGTPRDNLLLITIDTLRRDHLSCYGYARATTPNIDRIASEGLVFDSASTPRAKTSPALASLFTGHYPHEHGVRELLQPLDPKTPVLAEAFRRAGYQSAAIVGNFVLQDRYCGFARGFDRYVETLPARQGVPPDDVPQRTARSLTSAALVALGFEDPPRLDENGATFEPADPLFDGQRPWFLWMHYMDPHGAYEPPAEHRVFRSEAARWIDVKQTAQDSRTGRKPRVSEYNIPATARDEQGQFDAAAVIDLYDGEIHFADAELGRLLDALRARGDLAHTWVVITSDHGESLGEQDYWFEHGFYAYESTIAVPLVVRPPDAWKDRPAPGRRHAPFSLPDLGLTLVAALELPWQGRDRTPRSVGGIARPDLIRGDDHRQSPVFCEKIEGADRPGTVQIKAVRLGDYKLIRRFTNVPASAPDAASRVKWLSEELYDLRADPLESHDLASAPPADAPLDRLREELVRFAITDAPFDSRIASDPDALRALKSLGY